MKFVVCPDSFKGSLSAKEVAEIISKSFKEELTGIDIKEVPLADGGEGTAEIIKEKFPFVLQVKSRDPLGRDIKCPLYLDKEKKSAFIESSKVIGLPLLSIEERNPLIASTSGLGDVIKKAIKEGCAAITVSLGGSATCDCGKGMMDALKDIDLKGIHFNIICDVTNPLLGENGAVKIFAPQKGAKPGDLKLLEERITEFVDMNIKEGKSKKDDIYKPGAGAAGGLGFAFQSILKADTLNGIGYVIKETDFEKEIENADLIITGEGKIDRQSLMGKVLSGVLKSASQKGIPVIAIAGMVEDQDLLLKSGIKKVFEISDKNLTAEENMQKDITQKNIRNCIKEMLNNNILEQILKIN